MRRKNYLGNWSVAILTLLGRTSQDLPKMESVKSVAFVVQKTNMCCCFFVVCFILFFFFFLKISLLVLVQLCGNISLHKTA